MESFIPCVGCGEPLFGLPCRWCTCERCGNDIRDGSCLFCGSRNSFAYELNPNSFNDYSNFSNYPPQPDLSSFDQQNCFNCGDLLGDGSHCERCFCKECGFNRGLCVCDALRAEPTFTFDHDPINYSQNDFFGSRALHDKIDQSVERIEHMCQILMRHTSTLNNTTITTQNGVVHNESSTPTPSPVWEGECETYSIIHQSPH